MYRFVFLFVRALYGFIAGCNGVIILLKHVLAFLKGSRLPLIVASLLGNHMLHIIYMLANPSCIMTSIVFTWHLFLACPWTLRPTTVSSSKCASHLCEEGHFYSSSFWMTITAVTEVALTLDLAFWTQRKAKHRKNKYEIAIAVTTYACIHRVGRFLWTDQPPDRASYSHHISLPTFSQLGTISSAYATTFTHIA